MAALEILKLNDIYTNNDHPPDEHSKSDYFLVIITWNKHSMRQKTVGGDWA